MQLTKKGAYLGSMKPAWIGTLRGHTGGGTWAKRGLVQWRIKERKGF